MSLSIPGHQTWLGAAVFIRATQGRLWGAPHVAYIESPPVRREVWWFASPTLDSLARQRAHPCGGRRAWAQEWCSSGRANHSGSLQEPLKRLDFWQSGVQFPRQTRVVCIIGLLAPGRFFPRHWHPLCTAEGAWTKHQSWRLQQMAWIQFLIDTMTAAGTNAEDVQLPKQVWRSLVQRSLTRVCDQFEVWTYAQTGTLKNDVHSSLKGCQGRGNKS